MGVCSSTPNTVFAGSRGRKPHKLPRDYVAAIDQYLPVFKYYETSTESHRQIIADHWSSVFRESMPWKSNNSSSRRSTQESQVASRITQLCDTFYNYLDISAPEIKPVF